MDNKTYIKLYRGITEWEWYKNANTKSLFIHLLLIAEIEPTVLLNVKVNRGQLITTVAALRAQTGLTTQEVRTALDKLSSGEEPCIKLKRLPFNAGTLITISKFDNYQSPTIKPKESMAQDEMYEQYKNQ